MTLAERYPERHARFLAVVARALAAPLDSLPYRPPVRTRFELHELGVALATVVDSEPIDRKAGDSGRRRHPGPRSTPRPDLAPAERQGDEYPLGAYGSTGSPNGQGRADPGQIQRGAAMTARGVVTASVATAAQPSRERPGATATACPTRPAPRLPQVGGTYGGGSA